MRHKRIVLTVSSRLTSRQQALLEANARSIAGIESAYVYPNGQLVMHAKGNLPLVMVKKMLAAELTPAKQAASTGISPYTREAILAGGTLAAMQCLQRVNPLAFSGLRLARSVIVLFAARQFLHSGVRSLLVERKPNADTLTAAAVVASVVGGKPESSLTIIMLSNLAEMLTNYTAEKTRNYISDMLRLDEPLAWKIDEGGQEVRVPVADLQPGDMVSVHTGEKICIDGVVQEGGAAVDQSSITGEYIPSEKAPGHYVYAGSVVKNGSLQILVDKVGDNTALARIVHMVEDAQSRKAPVQNFADKVAGMLVPVSFIAAGLVYGLTKDWQRALSMLYIDFSCGLKLSTATAISAAIGRAASKGVLIKGGNYIEALANVDTVVFDKTGTLTEGKPKLVLTRTLPGATKKEVILLAASAEYHSSHPFASAIIGYAQEAGWEIPAHSSTETVVARGIKAVVQDWPDGQGGAVLVGSMQFMKENGIKDAQLWQEGQSHAVHGYNTVFVAREGELLGLLVINDPVRPNMKKTINRLRRTGVDEILMLTGDTKNTANHVAEILDLDGFHAEVLPEEKATMVARKQRVSHVMMIGDGINDAPALAFADVGVAMGGSRTDVAVESAAVTIKPDDPLLIPEVLQLGRKTMTIVRQNFTTTIAINTLAMLLGAIGRTSPLVSAFIHNVATIGVVANSSRILLKEHHR